MSIIEIATAVMVGLGTGLFSGMFGIGGGVVMVPALVLFMDMTQKQAQGTSLGVLSIPILALAAWQYHTGTEHGLNFTLVVLVAGGLFVGAWLSSQFAVEVSSTVLKRLFALVLAGMAIKMWIGAAG